MHIVLLAVVFAVALGIRLWGMGQSSEFRPDRDGSRRTIAALILPALLLLSSTIAILLMGHHGQMWGLPVNAWACAVARIALIWASIQGVLVLYQHWQLHQWLKTLPILEPSPERSDLPPNAIVHYLNVPQVIAAQMGCFRSRLLVSQGVLDLPPENRRAIVAHEQAHFTFRDPLWTLGLNGLRRVTLGFPGSDRLWQDLLLFRECRADAQAALTVDPLVLAETLVWTVRSTLPDPMPEWVGLHTASDRLGCRVQALIEGMPTPRSFLFSTLGYSVLGLLPLGTIAFHHMAM